MRPPGPGEYTLDWTHAEHEALRRLWQPGAWTDALLAALPGRSKWVIQRRAHELGLSRPMKSSSLAWSAVEDALLLARYPHDGASVAAALPGRSRKAVRLRAARLGVRFGRR